jgi:hypothetical protein
MAALGREDPDDHQARARSLGQPPSMTRDLYIFSRADELIEGGVRASSDNGSPQTHGCWAYVNLKAAYCAVPLRIPVRQCSILLLHLVNPRYAYVLSFQTQSPERN